MKIKTALLVFFSIPLFGISQLTMDVELLGGLALNSNKYNFSDDNYSFEIKNGLSIGLGFDIWFPRDYSISFGYSQSKSNTRSTVVYPEGFIIGSTSSSSGILKDRIFYLGSKKRFDLGKSFSLIPTIGVYFNPFFFDSDDRKYLSVIQTDSNTVFESSIVYARFNDSGKKYFGAVGGRFGVSLEKNIPNIGSFSIGMTYNLDLRRSVDRIIYAQSNLILTNSSTGVTEQSFNYYKTESEQFARNIFLIEVGFKMPCSILLKKFKSEE